VAAPGISKNDHVRDGLVGLGAEIHDLHFSRTGLNPILDIVGFVRMCRTFRKVSPDVLLMYTIKPVIYGAIAGWLAGVRRRCALITGLGYAFTGKRRGLLTALVKWLYRIAFSRVDVAFFQNPDDQALFDRIGIRARSPSIIVNGSGVHLEEFAFSEVSEGPPTFLMIGRFLANKGVREYVSAATRVRAKFPDIRFSLAGWIDENPDAISEQELQTWIANGCIDYLGRLRDVRRAIASCSVYVLPSYREGTPRTVLEAMAIGRPIITTDAPGCRETVVDGENGFLVPVQSVEELEVAMLRFVRDPSLAKVMGMKSRAIVEGKYDIHDVNQVLLRGMGLLVGLDDAGREP
jgi:glycosyltransferase involved in cell wall biosynthesis